MRCLFTKKAAGNATTKPPRMLPQNNASVTPASMAPGMRAMNALSMASIVAMEAVSEARAMGTTRESLRPRSLPGNALSGDPT
jgi:hypothetical protein